MKGEKITISKGIIIFIAYIFMIQFFGFFIASVIVLVLISGNAYLRHRDSKIEDGINNQNHTSEESETKKVEKKTRKTFDEYIGINGLCTIAIIGVLFGETLEGILKPIGAVAGISAIYYLIKKRKILTPSQKWTGWILIMVWVVFSGIASGSFRN